MQLISADGGSGFSRNSYSFTLKGPDLDQVRLGGEALKKRLLAHPMFINPDLSLKADDPKLQVRVFEDQAQKLGLTCQTIQTLLQNAYSGTSVGKIDKGSEQYKVFVELDSEFQKSTSALAKLYLKTPEGASVPLKAVASWKEGVGLQTVEHLNALPSTAVFFDIAKDVKSQDAFAELKKSQPKLFPPPSPVSLKESPISWTTPQKIPFGSSFLLLQPCILSSVFSTKALSTLSPSSQRSHLPVLEEFSHY